MDDELLQRLQRFVQLDDLIASTDKTNTASFKVLEKNSFIKIGETETLFNWKVGINNTEK